MDNALIETTAVPKTQSPVADPSRPPSGTRWRWLLLVCLLLGVSGGLRHWRDWQFASVSKESETPPFPLDELPKVLGSWQAVEGKDETLEPEVRRIAGANDYFIRTYKDERSGQSVVVMVLYGLAQLVHAHTPGVCYPAAGFRPVPSSQGDLDIRIPGTDRTARFRREAFQKSKAGQLLLEEAYYSFLNDGRWDYAMEKQWKAFRHHPGMFKVQVQCRGAGLGQIENAPVNELLGLVVQQIELRLHSRGQAGRPEGSPGRAASPPPSSPAG